jgi:hypothetical protein
MENKDNIVGIHQPNFLPWIGYFNKIIMSNTFILLDDVQYPKSGGVWTNRHLIIENGISKWATVPIFRNFSGTKKINEIRFADNLNWRKLYLNQIKNCYSKTEHFLQIYDFLEKSLAYETDFLSELNTHLIQSVLQILEIPGQTLLKSSDLNKEGNSNNLLCSLVQSVGGNSYLCGGGAAGYLDTSIFEDNNIKIIFQNYQPVEYLQINSNVFIPGQSIIDAMMNCGLNRTRKLVLGVKNV